MRQTPIWAQSLACIVISIGSLALIGSYFFRIDEVISVTGLLKSSEGSRTIKSPVAGKIFKVNAKDGQIVKKNDVLLVFDTREPENKKRSLEELINLEKKEFDSRISILKGREKVIIQKINTKKEILDVQKSLLDQGAFQKLSYLRQKDSLFELQNDLTALSLEIVRNELSTKKSINQMENELEVTKLKLQNRTIMSPIDGIIFQSNAPKDGIIQAGESIMNIIPQKGLNALVYIPNKDIGFVERGQKVKIRVDAFPYTTYGELVGKITTLGADVLPPDAEENYYRFPAAITLEKETLGNNGKVINLQSGMAITGNIKLREKRVISLISDLLVQQADSVRTIRQ